MSASSTIIALMASLIGSNVKTQNYFLSSRIAELAAVLDIRLTMLWVHSTPHININRTKTTTIIERLHD